MRQYLAAFVRRQQRHWSRRMVLA